MVSPDQLLANPLNWRIHSEYQQQALESVLKEIGWVADVLVNRTTGHVIDGHLRIVLALRNDESVVPVRYVTLTAEEERLVLATFDPITTLAYPEKDIYAMLLDETKSTNEFTQSFLLNLAAQTTEKASGALSETPQKTTFCPQCGFTWFEK